VFETLKKFQLIFDSAFFHHANTAAASEGRKPSRVLTLAEKLLDKSAIRIPLSILEHLVSLIINLPIPIYSSIVFRWINGARGLPSMLGMYFRALYYRPRLGLMEPNVLLDQNVFFAHPKRIELRSFAYIDKNVHLMSNSAKIGRRVHIAPKVFFSGGGDFIAHDYSCVATNTSIITSTEVLKDGARCSGPMVSAKQRNVMRGKVILHKDAFIGAAAIILPDVEIAEGSVIATGVTVSKSTEPWGIYVGARTNKLTEREKIKHPDN